MIPVARYILWENPGTANFSMSQAAPQWWLPGAGSLKLGTYVPVGTFAGNFNILSSYWFEVPTLGSDYAVLQYQSNLVDVSAITGNVTSDSVTCAFQGMPFQEDAPLDKPHTVQQANLGTSGNHGAPDFSPFALTATSFSDGLSGSAGHFSVTSYGGTVHATGGMFVLGASAARAPVSTDYPGWSVGIANRSAHNTNDVGQGASGGYSPIQPHTAQTIWIAASHFPAWSAPAGAVNVKIKGRLSVLLYRKSPGSLR